MMTMMLKDSVKSLIDREHILLTDGAYLELHISSVYPGDITVRLIHHAIICGISIDFQGILYSRPFKRKHLAKALLVMSYLTVNGYLASFPAVSGT